MICIHVYCPGQGQTAPKGHRFDVNRNLLSLHSFVASLKKMSLKSHFIQFYFNDFMHAYSPKKGAGADSPRGQSFDVKRNVLSLYSFFAKLKNVFEV